MTPFLPPKLILFKLEEEVSRLRGAILNLNRFDTGRSFEIFKDGVELFKACGDTIRIINPEETNYEDYKAIFSVLGEALTLVEEIFEKTELKLPIFWESITVFNEKITEKLGHLKRSLESIGEGKVDPRNVDWEEILFVFDEINETLDYLIFLSKNRIERIA